MSNMRGEILGYRLHMGLYSFEWLGGNRKAKSISPKPSGGISHTLLMDAVKSSESFLGYCLIADSLWKVSVVCLIVGGLWNVSVCFL